MTNPQPPVTLQAYFAYRDAPAALRWLEQAFGFEKTMEFPDEKGGIMHAEMRRDGVAFSVFTDEGGYDRPALKGESVGHGMFIRMDDREAIDAIYVTAMAAGARPIWPPAETEWGNYRFRVLDLEGYEWTFGTHRFGESQPDWTEASADDLSSGGDWSGQ